MGIGRTVALGLALVLAGCGKGGDPGRGHRIAAITGCVSCHGEKLDGHLFAEDAQFAIAWSSNLSRTLPGWTDQQLERVLRSGRRPDGTPLWFMPTFAQQHLSERDMRDLIAWLRTVPPTGRRHPPIKRGPQFAMAVSAGFADAAGEAARYASRAPVDRGARYAEGRYLTRIACAECHGPDLKGPRNPQAGDPPDLSVTASYDAAAFARLLRDGTKLDGRPAGLMAQEAPKRLRALTPAEVAAIRDYLIARAGR